DEIGAMTEHDRPEPVDKIDVLVAVNVPKARALRTIRDDRVDDFLPLRPEARDNPRIGQNASVLLRHQLRFCGSRGVPIDKGIEILPLSFDQFRRNARLRRPIRTEWLVLLTRRPCLCLRHRVPWLY